MLQCTIGAIFFVQRSRHRPCVALGYSEEWRKPSSRMEQNTLSRW